jgi:predicted TIM-barrel fold metal-dependent hydrolase
MFYGDTALNGNKDGIVCGYSLFGSDNIVFGTDSPYTSPEILASTIEAIHSMDISTADKRKILFENAQRLLKL